MNKSVVARTWPQPQQTKSKDHETKSHLVDWTIYL